MTEKTPKPPKRKRSADLSPDARALFRRVLVVVIVAAVGVIAYVVSTEIRLDNAFDRANEAASCEDRNESRENQRIGSNVTGMTFALALEGVPPDAVMFEHDLLGVPIEEYPGFDRLSPRSQAYVVDYSAEQAELFPLLDCD